MKDYFGADAALLKKKKLFLLDMDGTIYNEDTLFDGTLPFLSEIEARGGKYVFVTNNSSKSVEDYIRKVTSFGIRADRENFFTSSQAAAFVLNGKHPGKKVFCMGTRSLIRELRENGVIVTEEVEDDIGVVLIGFDTELTGEKLRRICLILGRDLPYYGTNCDLRCPVSFGYIPDCGSISIMIKNCTDKEPVFIGKPAPTMVELAMRNNGVGPEETVIVGDRLYTDIATGVNANVDSICVLSGECTVDDILKSPFKPTLTFDSVTEIREAML